MSAKRIESREQWIARFRSYPVRVCCYLNECEVCNGAIYSGEKYHDGGYGRRAHVNCLASLPAAVTIEEPRP